MQASFFVHTSFGGAASLRLVCIGPFHTLTLVMKRRTLFIFLSLGLFLSQIEAEVEMAEGERLAKIYCASCHAFTEPDLLPQRSWNFLLMYMGLRMGIEDFSGLEGGTDVEAEVIEARKLLIELEGAALPAPMVTDEQWAEIKAYFMENAPEVALPQASKPTLEVGLDDLFKERSHRYDYKGAVTSMVHVDERSKQVLVGDSRYQKFTILDSRLGKVRDYPTRGGMWVRAKTSAKGIHLLSIGDLMGNFINERRGKIVYGKRIGGVYLTQGNALSNLYRPADMEFGDFDGDGVEEVVICNFGPNTGSVAIHKATGDGYSYVDEPHVVVTTETGAVDCELRDFNGDGLLDVAALFGNAREDLSIFLNKGNGEFDRRSIVNKHPAFGYVGFRWVDFDKDGDLDVFTINGDNIDSDPYNTLKDYQGIRLYLNDGDLNFEEAFVYPMYGAYGLEVEDFDQDGDYDLAAISFNPDYDAEVMESFVFLEQKQYLDFAARTIPATNKDRWLTMDAGDFDGDGDKDIVLGGGYVPAGLSVDKRELMDEMQEQGKALLVLENLAR